MKRIFIVVLTVSVALVAVCNIGNLGLLKNAEWSVGRFAYLKSLPEGVRNLYLNNPEARDFVFSYKELKGTRGEVDLSEYSESDEVPLFMQWDKRWGYMDYSGDCVALTGCGPVCLSMVAYYLTGDKAMSPDKIVEFATRNGYYQIGYGSLWTLISEGGKKLGLKVDELPLVEGVIIERLEQGIPIICVMGPGDFTTTGHFIVMTKYEKGKIWVNDPNSRENSQKGWEYDRIESQIKNLWALSI